jgi:hypothetical protein
MKKHQLLILLLLFAVLQQAIAQRVDLKYFNGKKFGEVIASSTYGEYDRRGTSSRLYVIEIVKEKKYYITALVSMLESQEFKVYVDDQPAGSLKPDRNGWQAPSVEDPVILSVGRHTLRFIGNDAMVPMVEDLYLSGENPNAKIAGLEPINTFLDKVKELKQQPLAKTPSVLQAGDLTYKVLPNPEGLYDHAIDTSFNYSHYSTVYLTAGSHVFETSGSTISRSLTVFNQSNYTYSWANVNSGPGGESGLYLNVGLAGYYSIMLRPYTTGYGTTDIILDGATLVSGAIIGGRTYSMGTVKGGPLNFFTCRLSAGDDTRMIASRYFASSARGYNDDYSTAGDWSWGLASRIKKDFATDSVQYGYVCAYSPTSTGVSDVYLGNLNSNVYAANYPEFPLLKPDDAIKAANNTGMYNCISWSGGITSTWVWPPSWSSTYSCSGSDMDVTCFDNFYGNSPARYPGAWTYTRTGATVNNAVVDVWALNGHYTHGSVRKPGNNHPHGYDWESKPGGLTRTFHPRNALQNNSGGYGWVINYYIHTGAYARNAANAYSFETDEDAVKAGVAVFEKAQLTDESSKKLRQFTDKVSASFTSRFEELYRTWKKTWEANAIYSDPAAYCKNKEFETMAAYAMTSPRDAMMLIFDKYVNGNDHFIGELLWSMTKEKYTKLLTEVKAERAAKPNDEAGRYRIHGDHDNGVLYVEKILKTLALEPEVTVVKDDINVVVSPNPVKDQLTVQLVTAKAAKVSVSVMSTQTSMTRLLQQETTLAAGTHRFSMSIQGFAGNSGDIIAVQVRVDGVLKTVKVLVAK